MEKGTFKLAYVFKSVAYSLIDYFIVPNEWCVTCSFDIAIIVRILSNADTANIT